MKEKLEERLLGNLDKALDFLENSTEFLSEQTPLVIHEILMFARASLTIQLCLGIFLAVMTIVVPLFISKKYKEFLAEDKKVKYDSDIYVGASVISVLCLASVAFCILCHASGKFLQVWIAPRLYLIEYIRELM